MPHAPRRRPEIPENGRSLDASIGIEAELDSLLGEVHAIVLDPADLLARFTEGSMTPARMQLRDSGMHRRTQSRHR